MAPGSRRCNVSTHELSILRSQLLVPPQGRSLNEHPWAQGSRRAAGHGGSLPPALLGMGMGEEWQLL